MMAAVERVSMPTYEYVCTSCDTPLEVVQSIHEPSLTDCPSCEDGRLRKVFGNVGVVFKGSGFYRTDSRGKSSATSPVTPKTETKKPADSSSSSSSSGSSGSRPGSDSGSGGSKAAAPAASGSPAGS
jgi:putative FmdB family regulatory protein